MPRLIGDGSVIDMDADPRDQELETLRRENRKLQRDLSDAQIAVQRAQEDANRAMANLRRQLNPLYVALQMVYGEFDAAGVSGGVDPAAANAQEAKSSIWESWKSKMPGRPAQFIDILLEHGDMSVKQFKVAAKCGEDTVYNTLSRLNTVGLIVKNGGRYSLKKL